MHHLLPVPVSLDVLRADCYEAAQDAVLTARYALEDSDHQLETLIQAKAAELFEEATLAILEQMPACGAIN